MDKNELVGIWEYDNKWEPILKFDDEGLFIYKYYHSDGSIYYEKGTWTLKDEKIFLHLTKLEIVVGDSIYPSFTHKIDKKIIVEIQGYDLFFQNLYFKKNPSRTLID